MNNKRLKRQTNRIKKKLNLVEKLIIESYEENDTFNESYKFEKAYNLMKSNDRLDSLLSLLDINRQNRKTFAKKLGVSDYEDFETFLRVLKLVELRI